MAELVTASHDAGALFQDDPGARKSGNARARAKGIAFRALVADCFYGRSESPHFITELDRAATPYVTAVEPRKNCALPPAGMAGIVSPYGLRGWTEQDCEPVKRELNWVDFQVRSCQAIQREPPVESDSPSSDHNCPADTRSWPCTTPRELSARATPNSPARSSPPAKGIGISLSLSP